MSTKRIEKVALVGEAYSRAEFWRGRGCRVDVIAPAPLPTSGPYQVQHVHGVGPCERSDWVRLALQRHAYDWIEFPALEGVGYRAIQAKRAGLAFEQTTLAVRLDATGGWLRQQQCRWLDQLEQLEGDYAERYAWEHADVQLVANDEVANHVRRCGWSMERAADLASADRPAGDVPVAQLDVAPPLVSICVPYFNLPHTLPETLASLAEQTHPRLDVLVIDDGSTQPEARHVFETMQRQYPQFRFLRQKNAGIGTTRNRGLTEARGSFFLPFDADNVARPELVACLVQAMLRREEVAALTCYFLAFETSDDLRQGHFLHAYRPTGGPHLLACLRNVYGDATALYRTDALRAIGGYEPDRDSSFEDWEAFVKLVHAGHRIDVVPEHLFYYRQLPTGFSRVTNPFANQQRIVRQFRSLERLSLPDRELLWELLIGMHQRLEQFTTPKRSLPVRVAKRLHRIWRTVSK